MRLVSLHILRCSTCSVAELKMTLYFEYFQELFSLKYDPLLHMKTGTK